MGWGSPIEVERRRRILVALWSYAYEIEDSPLVDDATFDGVCRQIVPSVRTGNRKLDKFFRDHFHPDTGQWIHKHPELARVGALLARVRHLGRS